MSGTLTLAATPLGNPADASSRLISALTTANLIAAEDTRRIRRLAEDLQVQLDGEIVSLFEGNEASRTEQLLQRLLAGDDVLLLTDAGMPVVSDPGYRLVAACAEESISVTVLPGPSAVLAALAVSGLPADRFCFEGFLPRKGSARKERLRQVAHEPRTSVLFESPRRTEALLADLAAVCGEKRLACVCRELTKTHEEVIRGTLAELRTWSSSGVKGEVTIVLSGVTESPIIGDPDSWRADVAALVTTGMSRRDAVDQVAATSGASRRDVYRAAHD